MIPLERWPGQCTNLQGIDTLCQGMAWPLCGFVTRGQRLLNSEPCAPKEGLTCIKVSQSLARSSASTASRGKASNSLEVEACSADTRRSASWALLCATSWASG